MTLASLLISGVVLMVLMLAISIGLSVAVLFPERAARFIPRRHRRMLVRRRNPVRYACAVGALAGLLAGIAGVSLTLHHPADRISVPLTTSVSATFLYALATWIAARTGLRQWAPHDTDMTKAEAERRALWSVMPQPGVLIAPATNQRAHAAERPTEHRVDRLLRTYSRALVGALCAYCLGLTALRSQLHNSPIATVVLAGLVGAFILVWAAQAVRRELVQRRLGDRAGIAAVIEVMESLGMTSQLPAGQWVRALAPSAVVAPNFDDPSVPWPWAGIADAGNGRAVVLARHDAVAQGGEQVDARTTRTLCIVRLTGARLPTVVVAAREVVSLLDLGRSVALESEEFNRSLWASGPDMAGVYALVHARSMIEFLRQLPDGATAHFERDYIAIYSEEYVPPPTLLSYVSAALAIADLIPRHLVSPSRVTG